MSDGGERSPSGQAVTFSVGAPGVWLLAWCAITGLVAVALFVWSAMVGYSGGAHGGVLLVMVGMVPLFFGPVLCGLVVATRTVKWIRVMPDRGIHVSSGALLPWADVSHVVPNGQFVTILTHSRPAITLRNVEDAERFVMLVSRYRAADGTDA